MRRVVNGAFWGVSETAEIPSREVAEALGKKKTPTRLHTFRRSSGFLLSPPRTEVGARELKKEINQSVKHVNTRI
jgi:hypothetical protein